MMGLLITAILGVAIAGVYFALRGVMRRGREIGQLCADGQAATAEVVELRKQKRSRGERYYYVRYSFRASSGQEYSREWDVDGSEFAGYTKGQALDIVYLPSNPDISALKSLVETTRDAVQRRRAGV
jgi:hypothetical protein